MTTIVGNLPGGYFDDAGNLHRDFEISALTGEEEELIAVLPWKDQLQSAMVTAILGRCVRRLGDMRGVSEDIGRRLLVADRLYLLLKLREATFGEHVQATLRCRNGECGELIDVDFSTRDVPVVEQLERASAFSFALASSGDEVVFRLPNGGDQEAIVPIVARDEEGASLMLLARCVQAIGSLSNPGLDSIGQLPPSARLEIERRMEEAAPLVELIMEGECQECGAEFSTLFDIQGFVLREFRTSLISLYKEVHYLAYHYHWGEREIMQMPRQKRRQYIEVLSDEIERLNDAVLR